MIEIIPAIDIMQGKCVRLTQGNFSTRKIYSEDPLEVAERFEHTGLQRLHLVDLDGAQKGSVQNLRTLKQIAKHTCLKIDFGGGIKCEDDLKQAFDSGASMVNIGSLAITKPGVVLRWAEKYGSAKIILSADVKDRKVQIMGWQKQTTLDLFNFIHAYHRKGLSQFCCTDIAKDGMLRGASTLLYKNVLSHFPGLDLIASGGVSSLEDITLLEETGCKSVIVGKALYENRITLSDLQKYIAAHGTN